MNRIVFFNVLVFCTSIISLDVEASLLAAEPKEDQKAVIESYCQKIDKEFERYSWGKSNCLDTKWIFVRHSIKGHPLIWATFGIDPEVPSKEKDITMIMCGVHGDEITPPKFCFDIIKNAQANNQNYIQQNRIVIVAPLVNPDSFINANPSRTNAHGVDVNRNFPTKDWGARALKVWKNVNNKDPRRYPGDKSFSEPETVFQVNLIKRYLPDKIISVHAPLTLLDYDGPINSKQKFTDTIGNKANSLLIEMGHKANGYKIKDFPFFPGSLGNWAGNERKIPTYTLELPSSDPSKSQQYWELFKEAIELAITSNLRLPSEEVVEGDSKNSIKVGEKSPPAKSSISKKTTHPN